MNEYYLKEAAKAEAELKRFEKLANVYSFLRLFVLIAAGVVFYQVIKLEQIFLAELTIFAFIILFAWLVKQQSKFDRKKNAAEDLRAVNLNEVGSIETQSNIYSDGSSFADDQHPYTADLDIFGKGSLFNLLNRCATPKGCQKLAAWLSAPAALKEIHDRQAAVTELSKDVSALQEFKASLLFARESEAAQVDSLLRYFEEQHPQFGNGLKRYVRLIPYLTLGLIAVSWFYPLLTALLILILVLNGVVVLSFQTELNKTDALLGKMGKVLGAYAEGFKRLDNPEWKSNLLRQLEAKINQPGAEKFSGKLLQIAGFITRLEYRLNILVGIFLNALMVWDVRQLIAIEEWRTRNKGLMPSAFDALAEYEALVSLATMHINNSDWNFPEVVSELEYSYEADHLGHPLISEEKRVYNDFSLAKTYKIDIITGSNMAGKSTFLRTLGINAVMAFAGAPVCAKQMTVSVFEVFAYMRIRDSLNESISTFKAELNRLKMLLDILQSGKKIYFLIDEMLRGTNSVDKYRGSKALIEKLIAQQAVGVVATHDLDLSKLEDSYPDYIRNFYFDIQILDGEMVFDYKLKNGACKTFNASILLKQIGVDV